MVETSTTHFSALTRAALCRLAEQGTLSASAWNEALEYLGFHPTMEKWGIFGRQVLLLSGLVLLTAGLVFLLPQTGPKCTALSAWPWFRLLWPAPV